MDILCNDRSQQFGKISVRVLDPGQVRAYSLRILKGFYIAGTGNNLEFLAEQVVNIVRDELADLGNGIDSDALERTKTKTATSMVTSGQHGLHRFSQIVGDLSADTPLKSLDEQLEEIDQKVDYEHLEETLMAEGVAKFADPHKALLQLIGEKRASLTATA